MEISKRDRNAFKRVGASGGHAAAKSMTPEARKERASKAAKARWKKAAERAALLQAGTDADLCRHGKLLCPTCDKSAVAALKRRAKERTK